MGQTNSSGTSTEHEALAQLFHELNGAKWINKCGWENPRSDPSTWFNVKVLMEHVVAIDLRNNELRGTLPECIGKLKHLRHLNLSGNNISGMYIVFQCLATYNA